jgi:hypothetical protein
MVVGFLTTYVISTYHHLSCVFESSSWRGVLDTTLSLSVICDRSVVFSGISGFLHQYNGPPRYNWDIVENGVKHDNHSPITATVLLSLGIANIQVYFTQALVSFKKYMPPPLPYFKLNICPLPLPHFASIFFPYLWSFRWSNYIVTLPRYFSFRLPHLNINTRPSSDELDKNIQRKSHFVFVSHWNGYSHFRSVLNLFRN